MTSLKSLLSFLLLPVLVEAQYLGQHTSDVKVAAKIPIKAYSFNLQDVTLLDGRFKENAEREGKWLRSLSNTRLLLNFRINAGMSTERKDSKTRLEHPLGGWEALDMELRGHTIGHVLSGLSFQYASTGNETYRKKADSLVAGLAEVQHVLNQSGYLSAFPENYVDRNIAGKTVWAPWYTLHKIVAGLLDVYWNTGNKQALEVATRMASWAYKKLSNLNDAQLAGMLRNEFGGMNEAWYNLYSISGNKEHKQLGDFFYHHAVLDPLAKRLDNLKGLHANTTIAKVNGEARAYELTADEKPQTIASYFWDDVIQNQTFVNGANSNNEHFIAPGQISKSLTEYTGETCNSYNMLKLTRHLFTWSADIKYADYYERVLYNHILGQQDPQTGMVCYFSPLKAGAFRLYSSRDSSFWCCVGSSFESHSKFGEAIYYHNDKGVFINLFIPSKLDWKEKGLKLIQETTYPEEATTRLTVESAPPVNMTFYIRYPLWAASASIKVNGKNVAVKQKPGSYVTLTRAWKKGDKVEITYPMTLRLEPTPDNPSVAAVMYGPIVLAGQMGSEGIDRPAPYQDPLQPFQSNRYDFRIPTNLDHTLTISNKKIVDWITPADGLPLTFKALTDASTHSITMKPYYETHGQRYVVYWDLK